MNATKENEPAAMSNRTIVERKSERELVVTRTFNGPARVVFEAWTRPELLKLWWAPKSTGCPSFPARRMFAPGAGTASSSAAAAQRPWRFSASTSK